MWLCVDFVSSEEATHCRMNFKVISSSKETLGKAKQILVRHPGLFSKLVTEFPLLFSTDLKKSFFADLNYEVSSFSTVSH